MFTELTKDIIGYKGIKGVTLGKPYYEPHNLYLITLLIPKGTAVYCSHFRKGRKASPRYKCEERSFSKLRAEKAEVLNIEEIIVDGLITCKSRINGGICYAGRRYKPVREIASLAWKTPYISVDRENIPFLNYEVGYEVEPHNGFSYDSKPCAPGIHFFCSDLMAALFASNAAEGVVIENPEESKETGNIGEDEDAETYGV